MCYLQLATTNWPSRHDLIYARPKQTSGCSPAANDAAMLACVMAPLREGETIMRTITSVVAASGFVSFIVWVSVLATQNSQRGQSHGIDHLSALPLAK